MPLQRGAPLNPVAVVFQQPLSGRRLRWVPRTVSVTVPGAPSMFASETSASIPEAPTVSATQTA